MTLPVRVRLTAWYAALLALVVAGVGAFVAWRLDTDLTRQIDRTLRPATQQIAHDYRQEGDAELRDSANTVLKSERAAAQLLSSDGTVQTAWGDPVAGQPMLTPAQRRTALATGPAVISRPLGAAAFRVVAVPVTRHGRTGLVVAAAALAPVHRAVHRVALLLALGGAVALVIIAAGGWWLARRALRPVQAMATTAAAIGVDRLDERVPVPAARDELRHLALTLNTMLDRIAAGVAQQRRLVADASHELRTPLTAMGAEIDVSLLLDDLPPAARAVLESARDEVGALARLVDALLVLAAADEQQLSLHRRPARLVALASAVAGELFPLADAKDVVVSVGGDHHLSVDADPDQLARAIRNLIENAIEFSPRGGHVNMTITAPGRLTVADEGPGIPEPLHERVFDRFFRADPSRTRTTGGTGLGLAIAREIVAAHGGTIRALDSQRGARLELTLPVTTTQPHQDNTPPPGAQSKPARASDTPSRR